MRLNVTPGSLFREHTVLYIYRDTPIYNNPTPQLRDNYNFYELQFYDTEDRSLEDNLIYLLKDYNTALLFSQHSIRHNDFTK